MYRKLSCLFIIVVFLSQFAVAQNTHVVHKGWADLRTWDNTSSVMLDGEWEFYWNKLYSPSDLHKIAPQADYVYMPQLFHQVEKDGKKLDNFGYATYRIRILTSANKKQLGIATERLFSASKVWINGRLVL